MDAIAATSFLSSNGMTCIYAILDLDRNVSPH
jgi:hypothetical protein